MEPNSYKKQFTDFLNTHKEKQITLTNTTWQYFLSGYGKEAVLILHGGGSIAEAAFPYILEFEKKYTVIAPTLPGTLETTQDAINGILAILNFEQIEKVHIIGFSMGGMIAQTFIRKFPERVSSLILFVTMLPSESYAKKYARYGKMIGMFPKSWVKWLSKRSLRKQILSEKVPASKDEKDFWVDFFAWTFDMDKMNKDTLVSTSNVLVDYFDNYEFTPEDLKDYNGKILIFESDKDKVVVETERELLKKLYPHSQIITMQNSGHFGVGLLQPQVVIKQMMDFLGTK